MSNKTYLMSMDTLKSIGNGALGALTFGAYNLYLTTKTMELNNEINAVKHKYEMDKAYKDIDELKEQVKILQNKSRWW